MHQQPVFQGCEVIGGGVAAALFRDGFCLPSGTAMTETDLARVAGVVRGAAGRRCTRTAYADDKRKIGVHLRPEG